MIPPPQPPPPTQSSSEQSKELVSVPRNSLSTYVTNDEVLASEILWAMKAVESHYSCASSAKNDKLFQRMFRDSTVAKKYQCGPSKCSYLIKFGLAVYFEEELLAKVKKSAYVVAFDESLNKKLQEEQMDIMLRFWDNELNKVVSRYFCSQFMGHTRAVALLENFKAGLVKLDPKCLLQVSMDGPTTNWKFYELLLEEREQLDADITMPINVGSCGLHVVHGGYKYGLGKTGWRLDRLMRCLYYLFCDAPARRYDYRQVNDGVVVYPLKFCNT